MKTVKNKTKKPIRVPLPGKKRLFLGPGKTGQVTPKAVDHPPLAALLTAGDLEIVGDGGNAGVPDGSGTPSAAQAKGHTPSKTVFRSGDG